ncbi:nicotinate-nucleotide adenylyltransferase [Paracoccus sp. Z330]|uniref:Probable nicotinate-nucleotide adenylyltransferase n=1 Tax=Paracoccus onchidii TaxID=3017813 RepID=A0ABT4ZC69_9RHOB|nr:nicotinate-nucleotide adenylyltransferase [Paracoccus onchidii]MDB6176958.1 nicotinate-nucleotide adenylyltransferase [Paracoccus onchidii]
MKAGLPIATSGMKIGLLGGSFDPAHDGHLHISHEALRRFRLDRIWWLVTPGNPLKSHGPAPMDARLSGARRIAGSSRIVVTDIESRLGTRMTADTIGHLQRIYPKISFVWLMGSDNLCQFHRWDRWRDIADRVPIGVLARPGTRNAARHSRSAQLMRAWRLPEIDAPLLATCHAPAWVLINLPMSSQSSTAIRNAKAAASARSIS